MKLLNFSKPIACAMLLTLATQVKADTDCKKIFSDLNAAYAKIDSRYNKLNCADLNAYIDLASNPANRAACDNQNDGSYPDQRWVEYAYRGYLVSCEGKTEDQLPQMPPAR